MAKKAAKSMVVLEDPGDSFEEARRRQIAQNKAKLAELNLVGAFSSVQQAMAKPAKVPAAKAPKPTGGVVKRSARIQAIQNKEPREADDNQGLGMAKDDSMHSMDDEKTKRRIKPSELSLSPTRFTSHNLMRVTTMSISQQEQRIARLSNLAKIQDLIDIYREHGPSSPLLALARARLHALTGSAGDD